MRLAGTRAPGRRARLIARASTVSGVTTPVGPGFTQNQNLESQTSPGFPLKGGGRRRFDTIGAVAGFTSKLALPVTVQLGNASSFVTVAVAVSIPGASAMPKISNGGPSSPLGCGNRRIPVTSKLLTEKYALPESSTRTVSS